MAEKDRTVRKIVFFVLAMSCLLVSSTAVFAQTLNPANGHYYELVQGRVDWYQARDAARAMTYNGMRGHLATVTSADENDFLNSTFSSVIGSQKIWIGGTDEPSEGNWQWITGEPWGYTNWNPGEPNDIGGEDCLQFFDQSGPTWNDENCGNTLSYYLVEYEIVPTVPAVNEWGILVFVLLAGAGAVYYLRRQKKAEA